MVKIYTFYSSILNGNFKEVKDRLDHIDGLTTEASNGLPKNIIQDPTNANRFFVQVDDGEIELNKNKRKILNKFENFVYYFDDNEKLSQFSEKFSKFLKNGE